MPFAGGYDAEEDCCCFSASVAADEQPVFSAYGYASERVFCLVVVDRQVAVSCVNCQGVELIEGIFDG